MKVLITVILIAAFVSCSPKYVSKKSASELYVEGMKLFEMRKYDRAIKNFSAIREDHPFDPVAPYALMRLADCYFMKKDYVTASGLYEEFLKFYPNDRNVDYVTFRAGNCYEKMSLSPERDQEYTYKALEKYSTLINRSPGSEYSKSAEERMRLLTQKLAERELQIGEFYCKTYEYNACILRLEYLLNNYPQAKGIDKALYYLSKAYRELGDEKKSEYYLRRLKAEYPNNPHLPKEPAGSKNRKERIMEPSLERSEEEKFSFLDRKKNIEIQASKMEGFEKERRVVFEGNVILRQEDLTILCDTLFATLSEDKKEIEYVRATGNVRILKAGRTLKCDEAEFDNLSQKVTLRGNVEVISGLDRLKGDVIYYYPSEDKVVVEGKEKRARVIIWPKD